MLLFIIYMSPDFSTEGPKSWNELKHSSLWKKKRHRDPISSRMAGPTFFSLCLYTL